MLDQGIHMLDLIRYFMGTIRVENSMVDNLVWHDIPTEDSAMVIFRSDDGGVASLHSSAIQWKHKFNMDIVCEKGFINLDGILTATKSYGEETITYFRKDLEEKTGMLGKPKEHTLCFDSDESWNYEMQEMYEAICENKDVVNGTASQAVEIMELIDDIYHKSYLKVI